jgi:death on curing protein
VQIIHDELVSTLWPGSEAVPSGGCRDRGLLESAVNRPFQSAFGDDAYPDLITKAAALFHSLVANHCFVDGNKRTAVLALQHFLVVNGASPVLTSEQMYDLARETASHSVRGVSAAETFNEIVAILTERTIAFSRLRSAGHRNLEIRNAYKTLIEQQKILKRAIRMSAEMDVMIAHAASLGWPT